MVGVFKSKLQLLRFVVSSLYDELACEDIVDLLYIARCAVCCTTNTQQIEASGVSAYAMNLMEEEDDQVESCLERYLGIAVLVLC